MAGIRYWRPATCLRLKKLKRLEDQPQPKLELSTALLRCVDAEVTTVQVVRRTETVYVIEQVVGLRPELDIKGLGYPQVLEERSVYKLLPVASENVTSKGSKFGPGWVVGKNRRTCRTQDYALERFRRARSTAGSIGDDVNATAVCQNRKRRPALDCYVSV